MVQKHHPHPIRKKCDTFITGEDSPQRLLKYPLVISSSFISIVTLISLISIVTLISLISIVTLISLISIVTLISLISIVTLISLISALSRLGCFCCLLSYCFFHFWC